MMITLIFITTAIMLFWAYASYKVSYWKRRGVEFLTPNLIFGNFKDAFLFRSSPGWHIGDLHKMSLPDAPFVGFYVFHKPCLLLRDPDIIKHILIRDFDNFSDRHFAGPNQKDSIGMKNLFGLNNPTWKYLRKKFTPALTSNKLKQMLPLLMEAAEPMMKYIEDQLANHDNVNMVDIQNLNYKYTTDIIASIAFGTKINSFYYPEEFSASVQRIFYGLKRKIALLIVFFIPELIQVLGTGILFDSSFMRKIFWNAVENREKTGEKRCDFIDSLLQMKNGEQNPIYKFEGENLVYQSGTFFSGFESSSTCTSFTLMELAKHPEYQDLARKDINNAIEKHGWTFEAFKEMKYLKQVILESLRLHPPVSTLDRYTHEDYEIPNTDVIIEKGTPIYISLYGLGTDPRYWDEPEVFNPDRFAEGNHISDAYMTFGIGPRMCVGMKIGQLHAKIVLALLLRNYEIYQTKGHTKYFDPRSIFIAASDGINLYFKKIRECTPNENLY